MMTLVSHGVGSLAAIGGVIEALGAFGIGGAAGVFAEAFDAVVVVGGEGAAYPLVAVFGRDAFEAAVGDDEAWAQVTTVLVGAEGLGAFGIGMAADVLAVSVVAVVVSFGIGAARSQVAVCSLGALEGAIGDTLSRIAAVVFVGKSLGAFSVVLAAEVGAVAVAAVVIVCGIRTAGPLRAVRWRGAFQDAHGQRFVLTDAGQTLLAVRTRAAGSIAAVVATLFASAVGGARAFYAQARLAIEASLARATGAVAAVVATLQAGACRGATRWPTAALQARQAHGARPAQVAAAVVATLFASTVWGASLDAGAGGTELLALLKEFPTGAGSVALDQIDTFALRLLGLADRV